MRYTAAMPLSLSSITLRRRLAVELLALVTLLATAVAALYDAERAREEARQIAAVDSQLQSLALQSVLERYRGLPEIWSREPSLVRAMARPDQASLAVRGQQLTYLSGAWATGFFDAQGRVISWSDRAGAQVPFDRLPDALRVPASQQRLGRMFIRYQGRPLYAFASGVGRLGSIVVFVDLTSIQEQWGLLTHPVAVVDANRNVILSNRADWIGGPLEPPSDWVVTQQRLSVEDWTLHSLSAVDLQRIWVVVALGLATGILVWGLLSRFFRRQLAEVRDQRLRQASALRLERQVRARTRELTLAQESQIQTAKLAAIGQMSTTLAHEFNQPIATIQTYAENAQQFLNRDQLDPVRDNLGHIIRQTQRMGTLSKTLLSFARRPDADHSLVGWQSTLNEALILLKPRIDQQQVSIEITGHEQPVWAGPVRLTQVWLNLLTNALDALRETPAPRIQIDRVDSGVIEIRDNGSGIAPDVQRTLFEPFVTTKPAGSGLGLGLALIRDLMRQFGGEVECLGGSQGACFRLQFQTQPLQD